MGWKMCYNGKWKRGRVVEGARLEIVWASNSLGGSNPLASARSKELKLKPGRVYFNLISFG